MHQYSFENQLRRVREAVGDQPQSGIFRSGVQDTVSARLRQKGGFLSAKIRTIRCTVKIFAFGGLAGLDSGAEGSPL